MISKRVLIAQADGTLATFLTSKCQAHFQTVRVVQTLAGLWQALAHERPDAAIIDLELIGFDELQKLCREYRAVAVVCTHRIADESMWMACLEAGALDCCQPKDFVSVLRAATRSAEYDSANAA